MAAAMMVQQAAGGALLSPAAASFAWQAVAVAAPRVLTLMQSHRTYSSAAPSTSPPLHLLHRRPSPSSPAPAASGSRYMASYSFNKHTNSLLQVEEEKMRRNKELAMALMQETQPATGSGEEEVKGINHLLALLGVSDGNGKKGAEEALREHRGLVEKKKRALLMELLNDGDKDGHGRQEKTADLAAAARQLRDALSRHDHQRKLQSLCSYGDEDAEGLRGRREGAEDAIGHGAEEAHGRHDCRQNRQRDDQYFGQVHP
ncbi:hypothetical protein BRADI_2g03683v3 [Brachypodium distachyon]|uniref:Uncharacterized protein n=1 Tax=Brachypodium distachyon TaxID=15368 RepID=A0A2K2D6Q3_BRADI|nr:hypothetical protein BRADI_2g03683v3 [Brachypodium distachyon]